MGWLQDIVDTFQLDKLNTLTGLMGVSVAGIAGWAWGFINRADKKKVIEGLKADLHRTETELGVAQQRLQAFAPQDWLASADELRRYGKDDDAASALRIGFENVRADLAKVSLQLADHHAGRSGIREQEIGEARALARIATLLDPASREAATLARELDEAAASSELEAGRYDRNDPAWSEAIETASEEEAARHVDALVNRSLAQADAGHYFLALRLAAFAVRVARGAHLAETDRGCYARWSLAAALAFCGLHEEALAEIEAYAPIQTRILSEENRSVLRTRSLRANTLSLLGRHAEALAEIETFGPIESRVLDGESLRVLTTRSLRASTLLYLGRNAEALVEIDAYGPIQSRVLNGEDTRVLNTRWLRSLVLSGLGRFDEALGDARLARTSLVEFPGASDSSTLRARYAEARALAGLGRSAEALAILREIEPLMAAAGEIENLPLKATRALLRELDGGPGGGAAAAG